jgi:hypothetical protein
MISGRFFLIRSGDEESKIILRFLARLKIAEIQISAGSMYSENSFIRIDLL